MISNNGIGPAFEIHRPPRGKYLIQHQIAEGRCKSRISSRQQHRTAINNGCSPKNQVRRDSRGDFSAEGKNAGVAFGGFGFGNVAHFDVELGEGGPSQEVVGAEVGGHEGRPEGGLELPVAHEGHAEGVPSVEVVRLPLGGLPVEGGRFRQFPHGNVAAGFVKEILGGGQGEGIYEG